MRGVKGARRAVVVVAAALVMVAAASATANPGDLGRTVGPNGPGTMGRPGPALQAEARAFEPDNRELLFTRLRRDAVTGRTDFALVRLRRGRLGSALGGEGLVTIVLTTRKLSSVAQHSVG